MKIETIPDVISYFVSPITNTLPYKTVDLESIYHFIKGIFLMEVTAGVRSGLKQKKEVLPFITPSGAFRQRKLCQMLSYSGIVSIDLDDVDTSLKELLFHDPILAPSFLFVSPSKHGLKIFYRVREARIEEHDDYFKSIAEYLKMTYGVIADPSCRDVTRACFLCRDPDALFSREASVSRAALSKFLPESPPVPPVVTQPQPLTPTHAVACYNPDMHQYLSDKLNASPLIHELAVDLLKRSGWYQKDDLWTRPGKDPKKGTSAIYNIYPPANIYIFTVFTSSDTVFTTEKGYTDCQVIAKIQYNDDYRKCISDLMKKYNDLI